MPMNPFNSEPNKIYPSNEQLPEENIPINNNSDTKIDINHNNENSGLEMTGSQQNDENSRIIDLKNLGNDIYEEEYDIYISRKLDDDAESDRIACFTSSFWIDKLSYMTPQAIYTGLLLLFTMIIPTKQTFM